MRRLLVHVEGDTEAHFVSEVLRPHLTAAGFHSVAPRLLGNARLRARRGGIRSWETVRREMAARLGEDPGCAATMMVDYYGLPATWPGRADPPGSGIEDALARDLALAMGTKFDTRRFVPFVLMHEFEALLFSGCDALAAAAGDASAARALHEIRARFASPEDIDDSPETAPSKRIAGILRRYNKALHGPIAAQAIGLVRMRAECPRFDRWLTRLEALPLLAA